MSNLTRFYAIESFPIRDARNWKTFLRDGAIYVAIASNSNRYSPIYKFMNAEDIEEYQQIPVEGVFDVQPVDTGNELYLVYASIHGPTSTIFRWDKSKKIFIQHQIVQAYGTDVESFKIGDEHFISFVGESACARCPVLANAHQCVPILLAAIHLLSFVLCSNFVFCYLLAMENGPFVTMYKLSKEGNFTKYGSIRDDQKAYSMHHFQIGNEHFLAIARFSNKPSVILRWDGKTFRQHQIIDSCWVNNSSYFMSHSFMSFHQLRI